MKGLIFDIQSHSVHDGPGCRTTVFLNGCPLSCKWCSNPEGLTLKQQLMYSSKKCKLCLRCINNCKSNAIKAENNSLKIERKICRECKDFSCAAACLSEAMQISGKFYSVPELMEVLNRDRHFWGTDGGVTNSQVSAIH
ncbi:MAG: 4Fe-4S cluster-binding domain-containing protein [Proteobacteria bacterium]|nr:4Fe-4S cluster-binding domain-containing protein [Pseudomonadota bacterium]